MYYKKLYLFLIKVVMQSNMKTNNNIYVIE